MKTRHYLFLLPFLGMALSLKSQSAFHESQILAKLDPFEIKSLIELANFRYPEWYLKEKKKLFLSKIEQEDRLKATRGARFNLSKSFARVWKYIERNELIPGGPGSSDRTNLLLEYDSLFTDTLFRSTWIDQVYERAARQKQLPLTSSELQDLRNILSFLENPWKPIAKLNLNVLPVVRDKQEQYKSTIGSPPSDPTSGSGKTSLPEMFKARLPAPGQAFQSQLIDAVGSFIAERFKEDLTVTYLDNFKKRIEQIPELQSLLPNTLELFTVNDPFRYASLGKAWRIAFEKDLKDMPVNFRNLILNAPKGSQYYKLRETAVFRYVDLGVEIGFQLAEGRHPIDILQDLENHYNPGLDGNRDHYSDAVLYRGLAFLNLIQTNLRDTVSNTSQQYNPVWISPGQLKMLETPEEKKLFAACLYQQAPALLTQLFGSNHFLTNPKIWDNPDLAVQQFEKFQAQLNGLLGLMRDLENAILAFRDALNSNTPGQELFEQYGRTFLNWLQDADSLYGELSEGRVLIPKNFFNYANRIMDMYQSIVKRDYQRIVVNVVGLLEAITQNAPGAASFKPYLELAGEIIPELTDFFKNQASNITPPTLSQVLNFVMDPDPNLPKMRTWIATQLKDLKKTVRDRLEQKLEEVVNQVRNHLDQLPYVQMALYALPRLQKIAEEIKGGIVMPRIQDVVSFILDDSPEKAKLTSWALANWTDPDVYNTLLPELEKLISLFQKQLRSQPYIREVLEALPQVERLIRDLAGNGTVPRLEELAGFILERGTSMRNLEAWLDQNFSQLPAAIKAKLREELGKLITKVRSQLEQSPYVQFALLALPRIKGVLDALQSGQLPPDLQEMIAIILDKTADMQALRGWIQRVIPDTLQAKVLAKLEPIIQEIRLQLENAPYISLIIESLPELQQAFSALPTKINPPDFNQIVLLTLETALEQDSLRAWVDRELKGLTTQDREMLLARLEPILSRIRDELWKQPYFKILRDIYPKLIKLVKQNGGQKMPSVKDLLQFLLDDSDALPVLSAWITKNLPDLSEKAKEKLFKKMAAQLEKVRKELEVIGRKILFNLVKYGNFVVEIVNAKNSEEMQKAISQVVLPPGSFITKRTSVLTLSVTAHPGLYFALEAPPGDLADNAFNLGLTAPIGLELTWGGKTNVREKAVSKDGLVYFKPKKTLTRYLSGLSWGVFLSAFDLGAVLNYRLVQNSSEILPDSIKLSQVFSPAIQFNIGLPQNPITLGIALQYTPQLRDMGADGLLDNSLRFGLKVTWDLPLIQIITRQERKEIYKRYQEY